jgi:hypothetical protein
LDKNEIRLVYEGGAADGEARPSLRSSTEMLGVSKPTDIRSGESTRIAADSSIRRRLVTPIRLLASR